MLQLQKAELTNLIGIVRERLALKQSSCDRRNAGMERVKQQQLEAEQQGIVQDVQRLQQLIHDMSIQSDMERQELQELQSNLEQLESQYRTVWDKLTRLSSSEYVPDDLMIMAHQDTDSTPHLHSQFTRLEVCSTVANLWLISCSNR